MPERKPNRKPSAKDTRRILGPALRIIRDELRHMSQDDLAQAVGDGMNPSTISRYESGTAFASLDAIYRIAAALGVDYRAISYPVFTVYVEAESEPAA